MSGTGSGFNVESSRPSSRVSNQPGGRSSDIFGTNHLRREPAAKKIQEPINTGKGKNNLSARSSRTNIVNNPITGGGTSGGTNYPTQTFNDKKNPSSDQPPKDNSTKDDPTKDDEDPEQNPNGNGKPADGNPVTGEGYKKAPPEVNTTEPSLSGTNEVIYKNRVPPGGYSSGLW